LRLWRQRSTRIRWGSAYSASPDPRVGFRGGLRGKEGRKGVGEKGTEKRTEREREGKEEKEKGERGNGFAPTKVLK